MYRTQYSHSVDAFLEANPEVIILQQKAYWIFFIGVYWILV